MLKPPLATLARTVVLIALASAGACDDDELPPPSPTADAAVPDASAPDAPRPDAATPDSGAEGVPDALASPIYALTTQVFGAEATDTQSYVLLTKSLAGTLSLTAAAVEIPGRALGTAPQEAGVLFIGGDRGPEVSRYELGADDKLRKTGTVSFLGEGVTSFEEYGGQFQYISATKAYWFDADTAKIVVWNPTAMTIVGRMPITELAVANEGLSFTAAPLRHGNMLYSFAGWRKGPVPITVPDRAAVIAVDTTTDTATVVTDTRCGYVRDGVLVDNRWIYMATETLGAAVHHLNAQNASAPCLLRFDTQAKAFDPAFKVDLSTLFAGSVGGSLLVTPGGKAFLRFLDKTLLPADLTNPINTNPRFLSSAAVWRWAQFVPGDVPQVMPLDLPAATGSVLPLQLGRDTYAPLFSGQASTRINGLSDAGLVATTDVTVPGLVFSAVKLR